MLFPHMSSEVGKVYNKSLELTKTELNIIVSSIILTFMGLLYYFESINFI